MKQIALSYQWLSESAHNLWLVIPAFILLFAALFIGMFEAKQPEGVESTATKFDLVKLLLEPFQQSWITCPESGKPAHGIVIAAPTDTPKTTVLAVRREPCVEKPEVPSNSAAQVPSSTNITENNPEALASNLRLGDLVYLPDSSKLDDLSVNQRGTSVGVRILIVLFVVGAMLMALNAYFKRGFVQLCIGKDGRFSNSQTQIAVWFFVVIATYVTTMLCRTAYIGPGFATGIDIPLNLLVLTGLSGIVFVGAKLATEVQLNALPGSKPPSFEQPTVQQLYTDDAGRFDLTDFQMMVVTAVAVIGYALVVFDSLAIIPSTAKTALPDVNGTILALFSLGQGAYLIPKIARGAAATTDANAVLVTQTVMFVAGVTRTVSLATGAGSYDTATPIPLLPTGLNVYVKDADVVLSGVTANVSPAKQYVIAINNPAGMRARFLLELRVDDLTGLVINPQSLTLSVGGTSKLTAKGITASAVEVSIETGISWFTTSDVATVDANTGDVTAVKIGTALISAEFSTFKKTVDVTVN